MTTSFCSSSLCFFSYYSIAKYDNKLARHHLLMFQVTLPCCNNQKRYYNDLKKVWWFFSFEGLLFFLKNIWSFVLRWLLGRNVHKNHERSQIQLKNKQL
jgi:hypothetical protein